MDAKQLQRDGSKARVIEGLLRAHAVTETERWRRLA